jgi:hypothetical protein
MEWAFIKSTNPASGKGWSWRHTGPDGTVRSSSTGFSTLTECQADALKNGLHPEIAQEITFQNLKI